MSRKLAPFLFVFALASALACGHDTTSPRTILPPAPPTAIAEAQTGPTVSSATFKPVFDAYWTLRTSYNREVDEARLLAGAWQGARQAVANAGVPIPATLRPAWSGDRVNDERALAFALDRLLEVAGPAVDAEDVVFSAIEAMADDLADDHTYFLRPPSWRRYQSGETVGFGYSTVRRPEGFLVWFVYPNGPAARAGLRPGDVIQSLDGRLVDDLQGRRDFLDPGRTVRLGVDRPGVGPSLVDATPEQFLRPVLDSRLIGRVAYIRLYRFPGPGQLAPGQNLIAMLDALIADLRRQQPDGWILDLRGNPGGSEAAAANVAGRFGVTGTLIENRGRGASVSRIGASGENALAGLPLIVLVNDNSSSSAEILAVALQDAGLARLMGTRTGGIVNTSHAYEIGGGGLFVTTERIFAGPAQRYLDGVGVSPDEEVALSRSDLASGHDSQLDAAVAYLMGISPVASGAR